MLDLIKVVITLTSILFSVLISAEDLKILAVKNTDDGTLYDLYLETDQDVNAIGLKLYDRDLDEWTEYDVSDLRAGIAIKEEGKHKVLLLKSNDFEKDRGGHFKLNYLYNGITGSRKEMPMKFDFNGSKWQVLHRGRTINRLDFTLKKVWGKAIGIEQVTAL
jgi:hypothetical protein